MRNWIYGAAVSIMLGGALFARPAQALPIDRLNAAGVLNNVERAQFFFDGRDYCWYDDGWHGPGFYWCGYAFRTGFGWGGGYGWHGWRGGHIRGGRAGIHRGRIGGGGSRTVIRGGGGGGHAGIRSGGGGGRAAIRGGGHGGGGHGGGGHGGGGHGSGGHGGGGKRH